MATMNIVHDSNAQFNPPSLSELLEPYAPGYVLVYAPGELKPTPILDDAGKRTGRWTKTAAAGKEPIRGEWQRNPQTYKQAAARARRGGNVGLMGGAGNLVILDLDADRDGKLAKWPELATTVEVYRDTGPDRGKFIVHIDGPLPPSVKNHTVGLEILSTGTQGVIYGRHQSGARILHRGDAILTTTATRVMQFWVDCGCELPDDKRADAGPPDAEAVARSIEVADAVMLAAGRTGDGWQPYGGEGRKINLDACPFNPADNPHPEDGRSVILIGADGHIGATCPHARCKERIAASGKSGWGLLKELAGVEDAQDVDPNIAPALMDVIRHLDPEDWVIGVTGATWRNTTAAALAVVKIAQLAGKYTDLSLGVRRVAEKSGLSKSVAARALKNLAGWFILPVATDDDGAGDNDPTLARRWNVSSDMLNAAAEACFKMGHVVTFVGEKPYVSQFETSSLRPDYMATAAFIMRKKPMTESELAAKIADREDEIALVRATREAMEMAGDERELPAYPRPVQRRRYIRQLRATVASPGPGVLVIMDMIDALGPMNRRALAEAAHMSRTSCWRAIRDGIDAGCLDMVDGYICLADGWEAHIADETPRMPTAGVMLERRIDTFGARIAYLEWKMRTATEKEDRDKLERLIAKVTTKRQKLIAELTGRVVTQDVAGARLTNVRYPGARLTTVADNGRTLDARPPHKKMTPDQYRAKQLARALAAEASAKWGQYNDARTAEQGGGWFASMTEEDVWMDFAHFVAQGNGATV